MSDTTLFRGDTGFRRLARNTVDSNRLLDALLRGLVRKMSLSESDLQPVLMTTIRKVLDAVKAQTITIFLVDPETRRIRRRLSIERSIRTSRSPSTTKPAGWPG